VLLESVTIENVGVFQGLNEVDLRPVSDEQPIILIGGLNGSGKTTLLDSIQLSLFGRRATISNRGDLKYDEFLRRSINQQSGVKRARVGIRFKQWIDGYEESYAIERSWTAQPRGVNEQLAIHRNGVLDKVLTETWSEFVEDLFPAEIAQLFFFDGEKIERFASIDKAARLLQESIHTLLGLNIVNQLSADLVVIERQKQSILKSDADRQKISEIETKISKYEELLDDLNIRRASQQNIVSQRQRDLDRSVAEYYRAGGQLLEQRTKLEEDLASLKEAIKATETKLRKEAEGVGPLLLLESLLDEVAIQHEEEKRIFQAAVVSEVLRKRDKSTLALLRKKTKSQTLIDEVEKFLSSSRREFKRTSSKRASYLQLSAESEFDLKTLRSSLLPEARERNDEFLSELGELNEQLIVVQRKLAGVPLEGSIKEFVAARDAAAGALQRENEVLASIDNEIAKAKKDLAHENAALSDLLGAAAELKVLASDNERTIKYSSAVRSVLARFGREIVHKNTHRIAELILDSFRLMLRKSSLIVDLDIDPETYQISLTGQDGHLLSPERLSAGERQLLAVSILWGLARASGRPLPVVVDTPLGRLDAVHRDNIVSQYFPRASHQVLLLSTDKEIDDRYYEMLAPFISRSYVLEFDEKKRSTIVREGYFDKVCHSTA
jgi:DNA sulfur modification protein DndD